MAGLKQRDFLCANGHSSALLRPDMVLNPACPLFTALRKAWDASTFVKLTLSSPEGLEPGLRNIKARPVALKEGRRICLTQCFATRELTTNLAPEEGIRSLAESFAHSWTRANLFTTAGDFQFRRESSGKVSVRASRPAFTAAPALEHDRRNPLREALAGEAFLQRLGVTNLQGAPRPGMAGKLRQIHRFVEILGHLLDDWSGKPQRTIHIADMGAGKGYLTFALAHALRARGLDAEVTGVEARPELVEEANRAAAELGFDRLRFVSGTIAAWDAPERLDILVALHACNTATDDALFLGLEKGASLLLTSPCCHQELRPQLQFPQPLAAVAGHGILAERQAEILTDALRAHLLELRGYSARVFEFVEPEHSGKNLMLAGVRRQTGDTSKDQVRAEIRSLWTAFGLQSQHLAKLLGEIPA
jgi:hypothetical protein